MPKALHSQKTLCFRNQANKQQDASFGFNEGMKLLLRSE